MAYTGKAWQAMRPFGRAGIAFRGGDAKSTIMAASDPDPLADVAPRPARSARVRWLAPQASLLVAAAGLAALAIGLIWVERIAIAHRVIDREIHQLKLSARYRIDEVGTGREVLGDVRVGDPANPDLSVRTLEIDTGWNGGLPAIIGLKLVGVRLRGTVSNGQLSFGSLDPLVFAPARAPLRLPDIALTLRDSVASIAASQGPIGIAISGDGNLRDGFTGITAVVAPALRVHSCVGRGASFHGRVAIHEAQPRVWGPLQMSQLACPESALTLQAPALHIDMRLASTFDGGTASVVLTTGAAKLGRQGAARLTGVGDASLRNGVVAGNFVLGSDGVDGWLVSAAQLGIAGHGRAALASGSLEGEGTLSGRNIAPGSDAWATLARAQAAGAGTMAAPLLAALRSGLARETAASRLSGSWMGQRSASGTRLLLPDIHVDGGHTARWLSLSRGMLQQGAATKGFAVAGDFAVAGRGFPQVRGQFRPLADGAGAATLAMPAWTAATTSLAVPILAVHWQRSARTGFDAGFDGRLVVSGPVPGGQVTGLTVPVQGNWSASGGLLLGNHCTVVDFDRLALGGLELVEGQAPGHALTLCPGATASAMLALNARGPRISMRTTGLNLSGRMNGSALKIATGAAVLTWPGGLSVKDIAAATTASQLHLAQLTASLGAVTAGQFAGGDISLAASAAAVRSASGDFRWANGRLTVDRAAFRLEDSATPPAFAPIAANDVTLALADGVMSGTASLRATAANRELARLTIVHDLASVTGHADVIMPGLIFDKALQPKQLSALAEGVIADAKGTLTGHGRFDWDHGHVTSSGRLSTTGFNFAAAFGPVKGVAGSIIFTDLLGLVTAPDQKLAIATINPGIEVDDGILTFALEPGHVLVVTGAKWPFLNGQLALLPTRLVLGATEARRYELRVDGLDAAKFLARLDLSNLTATGTFDGNLPLIFDDSGGRIEKGMLLSRPPGGTVSYVGDLTYKDLSPMANYAFQALRALQYRQMRIGMDGALAGNIVTRVSMQGVGQGKGAKRNLITNQIARLPIRFDVTITAPFMQLITSFRSLYDPASVADPRTLGLIDAQGRPITHPAPDNLPVAKKPPAVSRPAVQP